MDSVITTLLLVLVATTSPSVIAELLLPSVVSVLCFFLGLPLGDTGLTMFFTLTSDDTGFSSSFDLISGGSIFLRLPSNSFALSVSWLFVSGDGGGDGDDERERDRVLHFVIVFRTRSVRLCYEFNKRKTH